MAHICWQYIATHSLWVAIAYLSPFSLWLFDAETNLILMMCFLLRTKPNSLQLYTVTWQGYVSCFDSGIVLIWAVLNLDWAGTL